MRTRADFAILNDWLTDKTTPVILDQLAQILMPLYHLNIALQSSSLTAGDTLVAYRKALYNLIVSIGCEIPEPGNFMNQFYKKDGNGHIATKVYKRPSTFRPILASHVKQTVYDLVPRSKLEEIVTKTLNARERLINVFLLTVRDEIKHPIFKFWNLFTVPLVDAHKKPVAIKKLANTFHLIPADCQYEADAISQDPKYVGGSEDDILLTLKAAQEYPILSKMSMLALLFCPNNMNVERGFSIQKSVLSKGSRMNNDLNDAIRHIKNFFCPVVKSADGESETDFYEKK